MTRPGRSAVAALAVALAAGAAQAAAAPLSCEVRPVDSFGAGRLPTPAVDLGPTGDGAVAWAPAAGRGSLAAQPLAGGAPTDAVARLELGGSVNGLRAATAPTGDTVLLFQRTSAIDPPTVMATTLRPRGGLDEPVALSSDHASRPDVAVAADGGVRAVWIEVVGAEGFRVMTATRSAEGGWSEPALLAGSPQAVQLLDVRVLAGADGRAVVAWRTSGWDGSGAGVRVLRLGPSGVPDGPPDAVRDGAAIVADLALGGSPAGALVAWREQAAGQAGQAVMAAHLPPVGPPGAVRRLSAEGSVGLAPTVASSTGRLAAAGWVEQRGGRRTARVAARPAHRIRGAVDLGRHRARGTCRRGGRARRARRGGVARAGSRRAPAGRGRRLPRARDPPRRARSTRRPPGTATGTCRSRRRSTWRGTG